MMITAAVLLLLAGSGQDAGQLPASGPIPEATHSTIGYSSVASALEALRKKPNVEISDRGGWTIVREGDSILWSFSPSSYPAYPAVAKRTILQKDGKIWVDLAVECEADKAACDQMVRDFQDLNERIKQSLGSGQ